MENDHRIELFEHFHNIKRSSNEITLNKNKEEIIMDSTNSKTDNQTPQVSLTGGKTVSNTNSPKMGSRRIFTPQFKLQVLESYRNDNDCKGNQRATARKYNIHRRQIQKWLQCEPSLRSSVANINQNSVKHQFHNVSMQQQQTKNVVIASQSSVNGLAYASSQLHSAHLCLDSNKGSASHKTIDVPSISSCVSIPPPSTQETQDILDANLVAAVAASTSGTIARNNSSAASATTVLSPLRPSAIISANRNANSSMSPLLHHHHHHHYGIPTYTNLSPTTTVPILVHHLNNSQQTPYQYHNMPPYTPPTLSHHPTEKQHMSYFTPTLFLPSAASATSNSYNIGGSTEHIVDKLDLPTVGTTKTYPKIVTEKSFFYNNNQFHINYECSDATRAINSSNTLDTFTINQFKEDSSYTTTYPFGPMDLSLRHNKETKSEHVAQIQTNFQVNNEAPVKKEISNNVIDVVDLTYRKRKGFNAPHSSDSYKYEYPEKQQKLSHIDAAPNKLVTTYNASQISNNHVTQNSSNLNDDDDVEIEVGTEEKFSPTSKPVKLFKPYLLDECENNIDNNVSSNGNKVTKIEKREAAVEIAKQHDQHSAISEYTFPDTVKENNDICADSSNFLVVESRSESPRSVCSPATCIPTMSPTNFQYSKGSPASSGYESSTSTYSDTSLSSRNDMYSSSYGQIYSVNLQMQNIYHENNTHDPTTAHPSKQVQRWLEKDDSNSLETNPTIALFV